jgi:1,2-diacylglycerol 3-beta-glucosyltransferase
MIVVVVLLSALGVYLTAYMAYQSLLFVVNAVVPDPPAIEPTSRRRFNVLVPAHNEQLHLPRLLASLAAQIYPKDRQRTTVVADNCTDGTAQACAGFDVDVLERIDTSHRAKGYAIGWALERIQLERFDAIVIVDADSLVNVDFLEQLNIQMERGDRVIQCYNGVANPAQSWFTRLMNVSRTIGNEIIHPAKRKLGLSSHLMGNGMCFDVAIVRAGGWTAFSVGEDWEYYARLLLSGGEVGYSQGARVYHQESVNLQQASSQRMRWSSGRFQVLREYGPALLLKGLRSRSLKCVDASLPLLFPNPSLGMNLTLVGATLSPLVWFWASSPMLAAWFAVLAALQLVMFLIGVTHTRDRAANALSLVLAPVFLLWKMGIDLLSLFGFGRKRWKPTERTL